MPDTFDASAAEAAYTQLSSEIDALERANISSVALNPEAVATEGVRIARLLDEPSVRAAFTAMPAQFLDPKHVGRLEPLSYALWHTANLAKSERSAASQAKLAPDLVRDAMACRKRMLSVCEYHLEDLSKELSLELADIRAGNGYMDLASDLSRLGRLCKTYKSQLEHDQKHYRASDLADATKLAEQIFSALGGTMSKDSWTGRTTRALSMLMDTYDELRAAAEFIYRADPAMLAHFGSMYSTIRARPQRSEKPKDA